MFINNQLYPKPWEEPKKAIRVKTNGYFHERNEMWNSIHHSSPKISKLYLSSQEQPYKPLSTRPSTASAVPYTTVRKEVNTELLNHRKREREARQIKSGQISLPESDTESTNARFVTFKNPSANTLHHKFSTFDKYNDLPAEKLDLLIDPRIIKVDEDAVENIQIKIEEQKIAEENKKKWHEENRMKTIKKFKVLCQKNKEKEEKAGVVHIKTENSRPSSKCSERLNQLSAPSERKIPKVDELPESRGLLNVDFPEAIAVYMNKGGYIPLTTRRAEAFPLTDFQKKTLSKPDLQEANWRPTTSRMPTRVQSARPSIGYTDREFNEIQEGMQALNEFDRKFGSMKGRVGFPQIYLEKFKKKDENN